MRELSIKNTHVTIFPKTIRKGTKKNVSAFKKTDPHR